MNNIGEKFTVDFSIASKLCKKLCHIEMRIAFCAEFDSKMVAIEYVD